MPTQTNEDTFQEYTGYLVWTDPNSLLDGFTQGTGVNSGNYYKHVTNYVFEQGSLVENGTQNELHQHHPAYSQHLGLARVGDYPERQRHQFDAWRHAEHGERHIDRQRGDQHRYVHVGNLVQFAQLRYSKAEVPPPFTGPGAYL